MFGHVQVATMAPKAARMLIPWYQRKAMLEATQLVKIARKIANKRTREAKLAARLADETSNKKLARLADEKVQRKKKQPNKTKRRSQLGLQMRKCGEGNIRKEKREARSACR